MSEQQPKYRFYPSLLDKFQQLKDAQEEFESFFNMDGEGGYKYTLEEIVAKREQELLDAINRVPHEPIEKADKGTAFNEIVDCIVHNRKSTNPALTLSKVPGIIRASINGFTFDFDMQMCKDAAHYFKGSTSQYYVHAPLETAYGTVELYGYLDELRSDKVYDIKTTGDYAFGKFLNHWQHHTYPYCLIEHGDCTEVTEFEYTVFQLKDPTKAVPYITATMYRERYDFNYERSRSLLKGICEEFIEWIEEHREKIYNMRIFNQEQPTPYYMFFDTETTGLPKNYNAPATDTNNWPRLVQLGWIVTDKSGVVCKQGNFIVKPEGFEIPEQASSVHGITTEVAAAKGKKLINVLNWWFNDFADCGVIVGHNIPFDTHVVGAELCRIGQEGICNAVMKYKTIDTMRSSMQWCDVRKADGSVKFPKLIELYTKLFGHGFEDAHDAMADIAATKECFFELVKRGIIKEG